jgi:hypothetical protein
MVGTDRIYLNSNYFLTVCIEMENLTFFDIKKAP